MIGWLYIAASLALYGLYFFAYNLSLGYAKISYSLNAITFLLLITVPVLTMRSLAEERKSNTDQLWRQYIRLQCFLLRQRRFC